MGYGLDVGSNLSMLVGLSRKGGSWRLKTALALPGLAVDNEQKPEFYDGAPLGRTFQNLSALGIKAANPATLVPGKDVYYRFAPATGNQRLIEQQVQMEAEEVGGGDASILADYVSGVDFDYAPVLHIALAREEVIDFYSNCLSASGIETGPLVPGCAALFQAVLMSGVAEDENVILVCNIGDDHSDIVLVRENKLLYCRTMAMGVNDFIGQLMPIFGPDRDAVRQVLFQKVDLRPSVAADNISGDRGVQAGQEVASRLIQQIGASVMLAKGAQKAPKLEARKFVICGPGAAIPGLRELMMNRTRKTVEVLDPLARIDLEGADDTTRETANSYRPALAMALGLAALASDAKAERAEFLPGSVRKRREFLNHSLFLYLAAAVVVAVLLPLYILTSRSVDDAGTLLKQRQQGPIGRYLGASGEMAMYEKSHDRAEKRADAALVATGPGRVSTNVLLEFSRVRPDEVRIRKVELLTETKNPKGDKDFKPRTIMKMTFFIERGAGNDPIAVNNQLRDVLTKLPGVANVETGKAEENRETQGLDVVHTLVLDFGTEGGTP